VRARWSPIDYRDHALGEAKSRIQRFRDGAIHYIHSAFLASALPDATMFTLTHRRDVFVAEAISDLIEKAGLKGFSFIRCQPR
jgi:hypothetical protein